MYKHSHFDLLLHDDGELAEYIQGPVYQRVTLHEWPLSCVQRVVQYDARRYIYKAQSGPTFEAEFYSAVRSNLLVGARTLYRHEPYVCLLIENLEAPKLKDIEWTAEEAVRISDSLLHDIAQIKLSPPPRAFPHYLDVSTPEKWLALVEVTQSRLAALVEENAFRQVTREQARGVCTWASPSPVLDLFIGPVGLVHNDLRGENIFILTDGSYRVIDWQRPILAPTVIDEVTLFRSLGIDPAQHVPPGALRMADFLLVHWCVECARRWYPEGRVRYDEMVAKLLDNMSSG